MPFRLGPHKYFTIFFLFFRLFLTCSKSEFKFLTQKCTIEVMLLVSNQGEFNSPSPFKVTVQVDQEIRYISVPEIVEKVEILMLVWPFRFNM